MGRPRLVLRFRNQIGVASGVEKHQEIIDKLASCWWGWWRRNDESEQRELLESLVAPFDVVLISPAEGLQFRATVVSVMIDEDPPSLERVPEYYRGKTKQIHTWFELSLIEPVDFDRVLSASIGTSTVTLFEAFHDGPQILVRAPDGARPQVKINMRSPHLLHLSDIHLGEDHHFLLPGQKPVTSIDAGETSRRLTLVDSICRDLKKLGVESVGAVVVSGDIVSRGKWNQQLVLGFFQGLMEALGLSKDAFLFVPGNHDFYRVDSPNAGLEALSYEHERDFRMFLGNFFNRGPMYPLQFSAQLRFDFNVDLMVGLLNSARWTSVPGFHEYGFVGREMYEAVLQDLRAQAGLPSVRMLVMHHHLLPVEPVAQPGTAPKAPVSVTLDAAELLADAQATGVSMLLHGHQHRPALVKTSRARQVGDATSALGEDVYLFGAGSAGSKETARVVPNAYSLFSFAAEGVHFRVRELDPEDRSSRTLLEAKIPLRYA